MGTWTNFSLPEFKNVGQLFDFPKCQIRIRCTVVWTSQGSRSKPLGSCMNFARHEPKTVYQLFELPMTQDQNRRAVVWISQDQKFWAVVRISQKTKRLDSWLNFPRFKIKIVGQLFQLSKTKGVWRWLNFQRLETETGGILFDLSKTHDQTSGAVFWTSQEKECWTAVWTSQEQECWTVFWSSKTKINGQ